MSSISVGTTTTTGYVVTSDTTGALVLKTGASATTAVTIDTSQNVTFVGSQTLSAGTANGVLYLNGSKVATSGSALVFNGTNLGVGVTPNASWATYNAIQLGEQSVISGYTTGAGVLNIGSNFYWDGSGYRYLTTNPASLYQNNAGAHNWRIAASGTAGNAITFTQAMTLDSSGNLLVGATSAGGKLHVKATTAADMTCRIEPYTNAYASKLLISSQSSGDGGIQYGASGGNDLNVFGYGNITFLNGSISGSIGTERARIDSSGNVLVNLTSAPTLNGNTAGKFAVASGTAQVGLQDNGDGGIFATYSLSKTIGLSAGSSYSSGAGFAWIKLTPSGVSGGPLVAAMAGTGGVALVNGATSWASLSDIRLKDVTGGIENALSAVAQLEPIKFTWKSDGGKKPCVGLSAQSVQQVVPEAVDEFVVPESTDKTAYLTVRYTELVPLLTAAIQEQQALIETLTQRITALEGTA